MIFLDECLHLLGYKNYEEYLHSAHWKDFRQKWVESGLPKRCIACGFPHYNLHHLNYLRLGREELDDVVPLCDRCHMQVHKYHEKHNLPLSFVDVSLRAIFSWTTRQCDSALSPLPRFRSRKARKEAEFQKRDQKEKERKRPDNDVRASTDYYKISRDLVNFTRYIDEKYTIPQLAEIYGVSPSYVAGYLRKFSHLFVGAPQLKEWQQRPKRVRKMVDITIAEAWGPV
jgi:hypothetical protein